MSGVIVDSKPPVASCAMISFADQALYMCPASVDNKGEMESVYIWMIVNDGSGGDGILLGQTLRDICLKVS